MFKIDEDMTIHITRGDAARFEFSAAAEGGSQNDNEDDGWIDNGNSGLDDGNVWEDDGYAESTATNDGQIDSEGSADSVYLYQFQAGDVIRFKVTERKGCDQVVLSKDFLVESPTYKVNISLNREDTKIGEMISKPKDYWYEIELNPDTHPQTIIGYDENGPKVFRLYPEGGDMI